MEPRLLKLQQEVNNETKYKEPVIIRTKGLRIEVPCPGFGREEREEAWSNKTRREATKANTATRTMAPRQHTADKVICLRKRRRGDGKETGGEKGGERRSGSAEANK